MKLFIKNAPHLKELEWLINGSDLEQNDEAFVKEVYKFQFKIVNEEAIKNAIANEEKTKAVTLTIPNADGSFSFKIIDADTCQILGTSSNIAPSEYYPELFNKMKSNNLMELTHYVEQ